MSVRRLLILSACLIAGPALADDQWEVTTSFNMAGMPFQMPPQTHSVCLPPGQQNNQKMIPTDKNCRVTSFTTTGSTSRFHLECSAPQQMSGDGEVTRLGPDAYKGSFKAKGNMQGQPVDMAITYAGRKTGTCAASENVQNKAQAMVAQQQAQVGSMCQQMAASMAWQAAGSLGSTCPTLKADICKQAKPMFSGDPVALHNLQQDRGDWRDLAAYCGVDASALQVQACAGAKQKKLWGAVAEFCGSEAEAYAEQYCTGRSYSVIMMSEYGPLCEHFADKVHVTGEQAGGKSGALNSVNQAINGINKLRGMFGK